MGLLSGDLHWAATTMHPWIQFLLLLAAPQGAELSTHKVDVRIAGPLAMVEVWRTVDATTRPVGNRRSGNFVDLNLPEGAALLDWEVVDKGKRTSLRAQTEVHANAGLVAALKFRLLAPVAAPVDEDADYRIHIAPIVEKEKATLHYRYAVPVGCKAGRLFLRIPESLEEHPVPAQVTVTLEPLPDGNKLSEASLAGQASALRPNTRHLVMQGTAPARAAWEITWNYGKPAGNFPGQVLTAASRVPRIVESKGRSRTVPQYEMLGMACRAEPAPATVAPSHVVFLVDRSRSVGQGGLSAERLLARGLMESLPPSVKFNAILFGIEATPVFPLSRMATREAMDLFSNAADPNRLESGTDLVAALARARSMIESGREGGDGQTWLVVVTDGALPVGQTFERMRTALSNTNKKNLKVLVLFVRQRGDDEVPKAMTAEYAKFVRSYGGLLRSIDPGNAMDTAKGLIASMVQGGDLLDLRLEKAKMADVLSPGQGAKLVVTDPARLPKQKRVRVSARGLDAEVSVEITPMTVKQEWLNVLVPGSAGKRRAWSGATESMVVVVMPVTQSPDKTSDGIVRGQMDPTVLRNALSLAFMPRARACYLSRRAAKASDVFLRGRMKLELTLERGELHDAVVRNSTLGNPEIESCVRKAAWAIEYPRPEHRDAPTIANVNLVFRPRTSEERLPDASPVDHEIEMILGPLTFTTDFTDLLESKVPDKSPAQ
jgi:hypothetical protein